MTSLTYVKGFIVDSVTGIRDEVDILLTDIKNEKSDHRHAIIVGGAAGNFTVTGIDVGEKLDEVLLYHVTAGDLDSISDLTAEVTISALNTINNTLGTASTASKLLVPWTNA